MYMYLLYSLCYAQIMSCLICFTMKYNFLGVKIFSSFFSHTSEAIIPQHLGVCWARWALGGVDRASSSDDLWFEPHSISKNSTSLP